MKEALLKTAQAVGVFPLVGLAFRRRLRVLAYHGIWITPGYQFGNRLFITPEQFEQRMRWLRQSTYNVLPLADAIDALRCDHLPINAVVITIDDGWKTTHSHMLPVLRALNLPATVYVTTWYVENQAPIINIALNYVLQRSPRSSVRLSNITGTPSEIRLGNPSEREQSAAGLYVQINALPSLGMRLQALRQVCDAADVPTEPWWSNGQFHLMDQTQIKDARNRGLDVQLHSHRHKADAAMTGVLEREIQDNRHCLENACDGGAFEHYCYPSGVFEGASRSTLIRAGVKSATTCEQGLASAATDLYRIPRFLDGRSESQAKFEAFLCGALDVYDGSLAYLKKLPQRQKMS